MTKFLAFAELLNAVVPSTELFILFPVFYISSYPTYIFVNIFPCKHFIKMQWKMLNYVKMRSSYFIIIETSLSPVWFQRLKVR